MAAQVEDNLESQRRRYTLSDVARAHGFRNVEVINDDLGRSASGCVSRPGFERLVAQLCAGEIGAVLFLEASRLPAMVATGIICSSYADSTRRCGIPRLTWSFKTTVERNGETESHLFKRKQLIDGRKTTDSRYYALGV